MPPRDTPAWSGHEDATEVGTEMGGDEGPSLLQAIRDTAHRLPAGDPIRVLIERAATIDEIRGAAPVLVRLLARQLDEPTHGGGARC
jgi:hypothetical protein